MRAAGIAAAIGAPGILVLALLALLHRVPPLPAAIAIAVVAGAALALALLWNADVDRLLLAVRSLAADDEVGFHAAASRLWLPGHGGLVRAVLRLARGLEGRAARAAREMEGIEAIIERQPDPLILLGADRSVQRTNPAARAVLGADLAALLRQPILRAAIERVGADVPAQRVALALTVPIAREFEATVIGLPEDEVGPRTLIALSDRTRERAAERTRVDFVANASHELRTPLASLIGFIDTLRGPAADDPAAQRRFLGIMAEQAERMNRLIDDLLNLSRVELVEHQVPSDRVDLASLAERVEAGFEPRLAARRMRIERTVDPACPPVTGDADQLAQVLQNLLDNAVKYGNEGGQVRLVLAPATPGDVWPARPGVVLTVSDDGPGIPRTHLPRLTERFYRVDKGRSRTAGGTGLGLAIVKHIVNRHRGQLIISSDEGKGARFSVWLPAAPATPATSPAG